MALDMSNVIGLEKVSPLERMLLRLEESPWQGFYRIVIGFLLVPLFFRMRSEAAPVWQFVLFVLGVLFLLRLVPAFVRHLFPFSREVQTMWVHQRTLAKRYDSYQWRKLFWIGLGLVCYSAVSGRLLTIQAVTILVCLVGGGLGLFFWRRIRATVSAPFVAVPKPIVCPVDPSNKPDVTT